MSKHVLGDLDADARLMDNFLANKHKWLPQHIGEQSIIEKNIMIKLIVSNDMS